MILTRSHGNEQCVGFLHLLLPPRSAHTAPHPNSTNLSSPLLSSIRILFSISDIDADMDDPADLEDFASTPNEEGADAGSGGVGDEHDVAAEGDDANLDESFPVEACITVTKEGVEGALSIDATAQGESTSGLFFILKTRHRDTELMRRRRADGLFTINNICYYPDAKLANGSSAEDDWKRSGLYMGPDVSSVRPRSCAPKRC